MWAFMSSNNDIFVSTIREGVARALSDPKYAFLLESTMNKYYTNRYCNLTRVGDLLDQKNYGRVILAKKIFF